MSLLQFLLDIIFLSVISLHLAKKNSAVIGLYFVQSLAVVLILFNSYLVAGHWSLLAAILLMLAIKVVVAPFFFSRLVRGHTLSLSASAYLNTPLTLIVIAILTFAAHSAKFLPLVAIVPANQALSALALSAILTALFLVVNRKGALSQIIGILTLENSIIAFMIFAGLEQSPALQMGIIFNIFIWVIIALVFMSMLHRHFGSLNTGKMKTLKE